eukprot:6371499-Alexandrium_andersonii.AAC.1
MPLLLRSGPAQPLPGTAGLPRPASSLAHSAAAASSAPSTCSSGAQRSCLPSGPSATRPPPSPWRPRASL